MIFTTLGINISMIKVKRIKEIIKIFKTFKENIFATFLFSLTFDEKKGINALEKAPSAKILLNVFGNFIATYNASAITPVPKKDAIIIALTIPVNLDSIVQIEIMIAEINGL